MITPVKGRWNIKLPGIPDTSQPNTAEGMPAHVAEKVRADNVDRLSPQTSTDLSMRQLKTEECRLLLEVFARSTWSFSLFQTFNASSEKLSNAVNKSFVNRAAAPPSIAR